MKKLLALFLALFMMVAVCACANPAPETPTSDASGQTEATPDTGADTTPGTADPVTETNEEVTTRTPWKPTIPTEEVTTDDGGQPEIPAVSAPETFPDGTPMEIVPITDGVLQKTDGVAAGKYATALEDKTMCIFDNGGTVKVSDYKGFLVRVDTENGNGVYVRFKLKVTDGENVTEVEIKGKNRTIGWYREGAWHDFTGAESNWVTPSSTGGYVYLPFDILNEISSDSVIADIQVYSSNGNNRIGSFSEWSLVKGDSTAQYPKLSDGTPYELVPITDGVLTVTGEANVGAYGSAFENTTQSIFGGGAKVNVTEYKGVMVKVTTTTEGHTGLYMRFKAKLAESGTELDIKAASRSYEWFDGEKWATVSGAATNWITPTAETAWVYVPFPLSEITEDEISDFGIYSSKSASRQGVFSDLSFVKAVGEGGAPVDNTPKVPELDAPTKLADETAIRLVPLSDGILVASGTNTGAYASAMPYQTTTLFSNDVKIDLSEYKGMLIKVGTTTENHLGLYLRFYFKLSDETEIEVKASERTFEWYNGTTWSTYESGATNWVTPSEEVGYAYFAFPFSELTSSEVVNIRIYSSGSQNRTGTFSDWSLVQAIPE